MKELKVVETELFLDKVDNDEATPVKSYSVDIIERLAEKHNMTVEQVEEFFKDTQEEVVAALNMLKDYKDESDPEKFYLANNSVGIPYLCAFKIDAVHHPNGDCYGINVACGLNIVNGVNVQKRHIRLPDNNIPETVTILEKYFPDMTYKVVADDTVKIYGKADIKAELSSHLMEAGIVISELSNKELSLEEYFVSIMGGVENA